MKIIFSAVLLFTALKVSAAVNGHNVDEYTGALSFRYESVIQKNYRGPLLTLKINYNNQYKEKGLLGQNWFISCERHITPKEEYDLRILILRDSDGQEKVFVKKEKGLYEPITGEYAKLIADDRLGYELHRMDGRIDRYDRHGRLFEIEDKNGRREKLEYDANGRLVKIINRIGTEIDFIYDNKSLKSIHSSLGNRLDFHYASEGHLKQIK
ncbi:MAG: RHS repeat domain-containing protein, partial [Candidatus Theseobacter exili]|nr:RHS repeat domain-containing protein [Candidatus Theseobacter exili]